MMHLGMLKGTQGLTGKIWPDGSFGYTFAKTVRYRNANKIDTVQNANATTIRQLRELQEKNYALFRASSITGCALSALQVLGISRGTQLALGLSGDVNYHRTPKAARGAKGITGRGRRAVRSAGTLLEFRYGKDRLGFATLTMPGLSEEDRAVCQSEWSRRIQVFFQAMKRFIEKRNGRWIYVAVTEIQPKRSEREGWNVPHLHFVFLAKEKKTWLITPKQIRALWKSVWQPSFSTGYDWQSCENLVRVKKSVAGYLSKYLSKGAPSSSAQAGTDSWFPSSWLSMPTCMKSWLEKATLSAETIAPLLSDSERLRSCFSRCGTRPVRVTLSTGGEIVAGATGWIKTSEWLEFLGAFWPHKLALD